LAVMDGDPLTDGTDGVSFELALDLRRFRRLNRCLSRFVFVSSESSLDELDESEELELARNSARIPGWDSSSILCCGVLSYRNACDLSWK